MTTRPCTIFIFTSLLNAWKLSKGAVETLTCSSSSSIQIGSTTTTFQFGDGKTTYNTLLSCTWTFTASNPSASLVIGQRLKCGDGDELSLRDGGGGPKTISCCVDCTKTPEVTGPTATIGFTSDGTRNSNEIGFYLDIFAGKDESGCTSQNNSFNISISSSYVITSPNFPSLYPNQIQCHYTFIPVLLNQGLVISFQFINLDYDSGCYDKIILKEGDMNGNTIAEICKDYGQNNPVLSPNETYRTTGSLFLHFISDSDYPARGFRASVQHENTKSITIVTTESTSTKRTTQSTTAESTTMSATTSEAISQSITSPIPTITELPTLPTTSKSTTTEIITPTTSTPTSQGNTERIAIVTTESTTTKSTTQSTAAESITVSTTTREATTPQSIISPIPAITERTTLPTTSKSTMTEIITPTTFTPTFQGSGCTKTILNGNLFNCQSRIGDTCRYECESPMKNNPNVPNITCNSGGDWSYDANDLCIILCPLTIKNGTLQIDCERKIGNKCSFVCDGNHKSTIQSSNIVCTSDGTWNENTDELCKENISSQHNTEEATGMYVYIGSSVAVIAVFFFVVAVAMTYILRRKNASRNTYETSPVHTEHSYSVIRNPGQVTGSNTTEQQEPVEYATIDDHSITNYEKPLNYTYRNSVFSY